MHTGVFKIPAIVRLYQIQTPLRAWMLILVLSLAGCLIQMLLSNRFIVN